MRGAAERLAADVVVVGGGVAGLVVARTAAAAGRGVLVLESAGDLGGLVGRHVVGGLELDSGAESFATRGGVVAALLDELGLSADVVTPAQTGARVHHGGTTVALPATGVLGIPTDLDAPGLREALGRDGLDRAREDLTSDVAVGAGEVTLAGLVRARMGTAVVDRLLRPVVRGVHSVEPEEVDADALVPGLRRRLTEHGSLAAALRDVRASAPAGSAVQGLRGGVHRLVDALAADARARGGVVETGAGVTAVERAADGWVLQLDDGTDDGSTVAARSLVLACGPHAWPGAADLLGASGWPEPSRVELATLLVDGRRARPPLVRAGTGVLVADPGREGGVGAKALTHATAKWAWLAERVPEGMEVLRLSYAAGAEPLDDAFVERAVRDAGILLGSSLGREDVVAHGRVRWAVPRPVLARGMADRVARVRQSVHGTAGLEVAGAWVAGAGLASVIPDAERAGRAAAAI